MPHEFNNYVAPLNAAGEPQDWFDSGLFGDPDAVLKIRQAYFASVSYLVRSRNRTAGSLPGFSRFARPPAIEPISISPWIYLFQFSLSQPGVLSSYMLSLSNQ